MINPIQPQPAPPRPILQGPPCPCCATTGGQHDPDCGLIIYLQQRSKPDLVHLAKQAPPQLGAGMKEPGYELLADALQRAYDQAARGKGKERHAQGEPFHLQVMQDGARRFGIGSLLFQAFKKSEESQRLPTDRAVNELLGSIVYLAGAVIAREREEVERQARLAE